MKPGRPEKGIKITVGESEKKDESVGIPTQGGHT